MIKISYKVGGRTVSSSKEFVRELEKEVKKRAHRVAADHVARVRCPVHGRTPRLLKQDVSGTTFEFCCEAHRNAVQRH
jgi:hypothetical protein